MTWCFAVSSMLLLLADEQLKVVSQRLGHSTIWLTAPTRTFWKECSREPSKLEDMLYGT